jgi:hypothetical protein
VGGANRKGHPALIWHHSAQGFWETSENAMTTDIGA